MPHNTGGSPASSPAAGISLDQGLRVTKSRGESVRPPLNPTDADDPLTQRLNALAGHSNRNAAAVTSQAVYNEPTWRFRSATGELVQIRNDDFPKPFKRNWINIGTMPGVAGTRIDPLRGREVAHIKQYPISANVTRLADGAGGVAFDILLVFEQPTLYNGCNIFETILIDRDGFRACKEGIRNITPHSIDQPRQKSFSGLTSPFRILRSFGLVEFVKELRALNDKEREAFVISRFKHFEEW